MLVAAKTDARPGSSSVLSESFYVRILTVGYLRFYVVYISYHSPVARQVKTDLRVQRVRFTFIGKPFQPVDTDSVIPVKAGISKPLKEPTLWRKVKVPNGCGNATGFPPSREWQGHFGALETRLREIYLQT